MKKNTFLICLFVIGSFISGYSQVSDSLNPFTDKEILKLSKIICELEQKDSLAKIKNPDCCAEKDKSTLEDKTLLMDLTDDSIHYYTGVEVIKISNYIYDLETRDSMRRAKEIAKINAITEYQLEEEDELQYFESVIYFKFDSYAITPESHKPLNDVVNILDTYKNLSFAIEGYCDITGPKEYNKVLSLRRANAVRDYFVKKKNIAATRIVTIVGYGADKFAAPNDTPANRAKNRRVIIKAVH